MRLASDLLSSSSFQDSSWRMERGQERIVTFLSQWWGRKVLSLPLRWECERREAKLKTNLQTYHTFTTILIGRMANEALGRPWADKTTY